MITFRDVKENLAKALEDGLITARPHNDYPHLLVLNYTDKCTFEKLWTPFTIACRGLVIDTLAECIVARPFDKFFNYEQLQSLPNLPFSISEKLDGSLIIVFFYDGRWMACTRGSFHSEQADWANEKLKTIHIHPYFRLFTLLFEGIYPENRIVIRYDRERLVFLGARDSTSGFEVKDDHDLWKHLVECSPLFSRPLTYSFSIENLLSIAKTLSHNEEGFVIRFSDGTRVKIKGAEYCRVHKIKSNLTPKGVWECLSTGTGIVGMPDEFYSDYEVLAEPIREAYRVLEERAKFIFAQIHSPKITTLDPKLLRKEYAVRILNACQWGEQSLHATLFNMLDGKDYSANLWKLIKP